MTARKSDQDSKDRIAAGMDEAGQGESGKAGGKARTGAHGHGADPSKLVEGMTEAGKPGSGGKGSRNEAKGSSSR